VFRSAEDCRQTGGKARTVERRPRPAQDRWAVSADGEGVTLAPVFGCRERQTLLSVVESAAVNRERLAKVMIEKGLCARIPGKRPFWVLRKHVDVVHIRLLHLGRLWISRNTAIPNLGRLAVAGARLRPDQGEDLRSGLDRGETQRIQRALRDQDSHPAWRASTSRRFDEVQLVGWRPLLGNSGSGHPSHDGIGLDRCARFRVDFEGTGSRLLSPADFEARFEDGEVRRGRHLLRSVRLETGQSTRGTVCFGGNYLTEIVELRLR